MIVTLLIAVPCLLFLLVPLKKRVRYIVAGILMGGLCLLFWPTTYKNFRLEKQGMHTTGILISKSCTPKKRQKISYKFTVGSTEFEGIGKPGAGNQSCENFQIGDQVFLTYLPDDPKTNSPGRKVDSNFILLSCLAIFLYFFLVWGNREQGRFLEEKRRRKPNNT